MAYRVISQSERYISVSTMRKTTPDSVPERQLSLLVMSAHGDEFSGIWETFQAVSNLMLQTLHFMLR